MKLAVALIACLCIAANTRGSEDNRDCPELVNQFMNSLPFKVAYASCTKPPRAPFTFGTQFVTLKRLDTTSAIDRRNQYVMIRSPLHFDRCVIPYFFPYVDDSNGVYLYSTPQDSLVRFLTTNKAPCADDSILALMELVVQKYSQAVRNFELMSDDYGRQKFDAYSSIIGYPLLITATALLVTSDKKKNRNAGYVCAGITAIGLTVDIGQFFTWLHLRREVRKLRTTLENWGEDTSQRMMESANVR